jgi:hypothetical protein
VIWPVINNYGTLFRFHSVDGHYLRNLRNRSPLEQSEFVAGRDFIFCFLLHISQPFQQRTPAIGLGFSHL